MWWNVLIVILSISALMVVTGLSLVTMQYNNKKQSLRRHSERMNPFATEPGLTPAEFTLAPGAKPEPVSAGFYVDRIVNLSMKDMTWMVDGYFWMRWKDSNMQLADRFQVVDGWIESKEKEEERYINGEHYVMYRIIAKISAIFEETRFPCDDHLLTICFEIPSFERNSLLFQPDSLASAISSRVKIPGYKIYNMAVVEKPHSYKTSRGKPLLQAKAKSTFSQFRMGIWIRRDGWGYYLKMFLPLYVAVAVSMLAFFINPIHSDPRFGLGVGALFAAVANSYINSSMIPNTGVLSLTDVVNIAGTSTILLTLIESAISLYIYEKRQKHLLSYRFDRFSFLIILVGYILINIALPMAAIL
jgi:hypothetical protein